MVCASQDSGGEEQVLPGTRREMDEFQRQVSDSAQYTLSCTFPQVKVHLPSNKFLEVLYNRCVIYHYIVVFVTMSRPSPLGRFAMDLALWEPASLEAVERANSESLLVSCMDVLQPAATPHDRFTMCRSTLREGGCGQGAWLTAAVCVCEGDALSSAGF